MVAFVELNDLVQDGELCKPASVVQDLDCVVQILVAKWRAGDGLAADVVSKLLGVEPVRRFESSRVKEW